MAYPVEKAIDKLKLMKFERVGTIKETIASQSITTTTTLYEKSGIAFIILFHGNGDTSVTIKIYKNGTEIDSLKGDQQAIEIQDTSTIKITAEGSGNTPDIEVLRFYKY